MLGQYIFCTMCGGDFWHGALFLPLSILNPIHAAQSLRSSCRIYGRLSFEILCRRYSAFAQCMFSTELKEWFKQSEATIQNTWQPNTRGDHIPTECGADVRRSRELVCGRWWAWQRLGRRQVRDLRTTLPNQQLVPPPAWFCLTSAVKSVATMWLLTMLQGSWFMPRSDVDQRHYIDNTEMFTDVASRVVWTYS